MGKVEPDFVLRMQGEREVLEVYGWPLPEVAPKVFIACEVCGGEGAILETVHVYEAGCGFSHPDVHSKPCTACNGAGGMVCEAEGNSK